jgi:hypothetical protein
MAVEAEGLQDWIGAEVVDPAGEKLGKVEEVYYLGEIPLVVEVKSGLIGRKRSLAALAGATVTTDHLRLSTEDLLATDGGLGAGALTHLAERDPRLAGVTPEQLEGVQAREERRHAAEKEAARAAALDVEASQRADEARAAATRADHAADAASEAEQAHLQAEEDARAARLKADELRQ